MKFRVECQIRVEFNLHARKSSLHNHPLISFQIMDRKSTTALLDRSFDEVSLNWVCVGMGERVPSEDDEAARERIPLAVKFK